MERDNKGRFVKGMIPSWIGQETGKYKTCLICKNKFYDFPSGRKIFCSRKCKGKSMKGKSPWNIGKKLTEKHKQKLKNAWNYEKYITDSRNKKISQSKLSEKNPMWKGNNVGYQALHNWIKRRKPKPNLCEECKENKPSDLANVSGEYKRDINDFEWLCRRCHMKKDGRLKRFSLNKKVINFGS